MSIVVHLAAIIALLSGFSDTPQQHRGSTYQEAAEMCGVTLLKVWNNSGEPTDVIMFGDYRHLPEFGDSTVFVSFDPQPDKFRVTRRRPGQVYHTSVTSAVTVERVPCE